MLGQAQIAGGEEEHGRKRPNDEHQREQKGDDAEGGQLSPETAWWAVATLDSLRSALPDTTVVTGSFAPTRPAPMPEPVARTPADPPTRPTPPAQARPAASAAEAAAYLARAEAALRNGDVIGARSLFGRLAEAGDPRGALGMARTYDPAEFKKLLVYGLKPDSAESERWRVRAQELGRAVGRE